MNKSVHVLLLKLLLKQILPECKKNYRPFYVEFERYIVFVVSLTSVGRQIILVYIFRKFCIFWFSHEIRKLHLPVVWTNIALMASVKVSYEGKTRYICCSFLLWVFGVLFPWTVVWGWWNHFLTCFSSAKHSQDIGISEV